MKSESSSKPGPHQKRMAKRLAELIKHARADIKKVNEPRFQALLETAAEVLIGLKTAFEHYGKKEEPAWRDRRSPRSS